MRSRRDFIKKSALLGATVGSPLGMTFANEEERTDRYKKLDEALARPVLKKEYFSGPVIIEQVGLLHYNHSFICRVRSQDGAEGISVSNNIRMVFLYPIFLQRVAPFFIGKDALDLDNLIDGVYRYRSNYKFQSYALWVPVATLEFALLDMLGKMAGKSMGQLIGDIHNPEPGVYYSTSMRDQSAQATLEEAKEQLEKGGYRAYKFKVGTKMGRDQEAVDGRTEELIPLARQELGDDFWLGVDGNGAYSTPKAIAVGKLLTRYNYNFYEEPVPFDWYHETKEVADAVGVPVAGGEQEASMRMFRWIIGEEILQIVRPDQFYFGGMIRSVQVARMAEVAGIKVIPHQSGAGLGYLYKMHFVSVLPNAGAFHPNSKDENPPIIPVHSDTSSLGVENGQFKVPTGPGLGAEIDPDFLKKHQPLVPVITE